MAAPGHHPIAQRHPRHLEDLEQRRGQPEHAGLQPTAPGLAVDDAEFDPTRIDKSDALDQGLTVWVDGTQFVSSDMRR